MRLQKEMFQREKCFIKNNLKSILVFVLVQTVRDWLLLIRVVVRESSKLNGFMDSEFDLRSSKMSLQESKSLPSTPLPKATFDFVADW